MIILSPCRSRTDQVGHARHRPVLVHHLADDARRYEPGQPGEIDRGLGLAGAQEHAAVARAQREDVAGPDEVLAARRGVDRDLDRVRAVGAEMPVVTPSRASTATVNAVPNGVSLRSVIGRSPSSSQRSSVRHGRRGRGRT